LEKDKLFHGTSMNGLSFFFCAIGVWGDGAPGCVPGCGWTVLGGLGLFQEMSQDMQRHIDLLNTCLSYIEKNNPMYRQQQQAKS